MNPNRRMFDDRPDSADVGVRRNDTLRPFKHEHIDCGFRIRGFDRPHDRCCQQHIADPSCAYDQYAVDLSFHSCLIVVDGFGLYWSSPTAAQTIVDRNS